MKNNINLLEDIYCQNQYSGLYLDEDTAMFLFEYTENRHQVIFRSLRRPVRKVSGMDIDEECYDLETPYGYGGPVTNCLEPDFLARAFAGYREHCIASKIVCEFIRFHPFNTLLDDNAGLFDMFARERTVVMVDLASGKDERWKHYSKNARNIIRNTEKKLTRHKNTLAIDEFMEMYRQTMTRNEAEEFYYFDREYFTDLAQLPMIDLLSIHLDGKAVSAGFFMHGPELAHYHLSANRAEHARENANYLLLDFAFDNAMEKGCQAMMLGGGRTAMPEDSLFRFKTRFSSVYKPFYVGGLDFMPGMRHKLNQIWHSKNPGNATRLFQQYRAPGNTST